ncbi:MAG: integrase, partial [Spirosomaceae bacterium]|nr:integrase [Spirosomataceae bacterium]
FTVEERNNITIRNYSRPFSKKYHDMLDRQVERQMKASVKMIADFWYTAWVDAGQPDLTDLKAVKLTEKDKQDDESDKRAWLQRILDVRKEADN